MTRDELAALYIKEQPTMLRRAYSIYWRDYDHNELEDLYHDCWLKVEQASFIQNIPGYIWKTFLNHLRDTRRNRFTSSDALNHVASTDSDDYLAEQVDPGLKDALGHEVVSWRVQCALEHIDDDIAYIGWQTYAVQRTAADLAIELNLNVNTVWRRMLEFKTRFIQEYHKSQGDEPSWAHFP